MLPLSRREAVVRGPGRRGDGDGRAWGDAGGAPVAVRGGGMSKSVAKASRGGIGGGQKRGISTFLFRHSGAIRVFATDLDNLRCRGAAEGPPEGRRGPGGGRGGRPLTPRRALRTRKCKFQPSLSSAKCTSRRGRGRRRGRRGPRCRSRPGASPATRRERRFIFHASHQFGCFSARRLLRGSPPWSSDGRKGRRPLHASGSRPGPVEDRRPRVDSRALRIPRSAMRTPSAHALRPRSAGRLRIIRPGRPIGLTNGMRGQMAGGFCLNSETCREGDPLQQWIRTEGAPSWAASDSLQGEMSCRLGSGGYCW